MCDEVLPELRFLLATLDCCGLLSSNPLKQDYHIYSRKEKALVIFCLIDACLDIVSNIFLSFDKGKNMNVFSLQNSLAAKDTQI